MKNIRIIPDIKFERFSPGSRNYYVNVNGEYIGDFFIRLGQTYQDAEAFIYQLERLKMILHDAVIDEMKGIDDIVKRCKGEPHEAEG